MFKRASEGFPAEYRSDCTWCPEEIQIGELITSTGGGGYRHVNCPWGEPTKFAGSSDEEMEF